MSRKHKRKKRQNSSSSDVQPNTPALIDAEQPIQQPENPPAEPDAAVPAAKTEEELPQTAPPVREETSDAAAPAPRKGRAGIYAAIAALLLASVLACLYFTSAFSPALSVAAASKMDRELEGGGLVLLHPAELSPIDAENHLGVTGRGFLARFENVTDAHSAHLQAGYTLEESAEALLFAGCELIASADAVITEKAFSITEDAALCRISFQAQRTSYAAEMELISIGDSLVLGLFAVDNDNLSDGRTLYAALRQTLRVNP